MSSFSIWKHFELILVNLICFWTIFQFCKCLIFKQITQQSGHTEWEGKYRSNNKCNFHIWSDSDNKRKKIIWSDSTSHNWMLIVLKDGRGRVGGSNPAESSSAVWECWLKKDSEIQIRKSVGVKTHFRNLKLTTEIHS